MKMNTISSEKWRIKTIDELLAVWELNKDEIDILKGTLNKREVAMNKKDGTTELTELYQIKADWQYRSELFRPEVKDILMDTFSKDIKRIETKLQTEWSLLANINRADTHIGRVTIKNQDKYIKSLQDRSMQLFELLLRDKPDMLLLGSLGDISNGEFDGNTTKGTPQQNNITGEEMFRKSLRMHVDFINTVASEIATKVLIVPWNHDQNMMKAVWEALDLYYSNSDIEVDNTDNPRKYHKRGQTTLGFSHGHLEKDKQIPEMFHSEAGLNKNNYFTKGHTHREYSIEKGNVMIDVVDSPAPSSQREKDKYGHKENTKLKGKLYDKKKGLLQEYAR